MNLLIQRSKSGFPIPIGQSRIKKAIVRYFFAMPCVCVVLTPVSIAGIAILSKYKPLNVTKTLPGHPDPSIVNGRIITLEFESYYLIGTYVLNAGVGLKVMYLRMLAANIYSCFIDT